MRMSEWSSDGCSSDLFTIGQRQQVNHWPPARGRTAFRQAPHFHAVNLAVIGEEQNGRVRAGDEQIGDGVLVLRRHTGAALAATRLSAEAVQAGALAIALQGNGSDQDRKRDVWGKSVAERVN